MVDSEIKGTGQLPACILNERLLQEMWDLLAQDGCFTWEIGVGTGGDLLGIEQKRPYQTVTTMNELKSLAASLVRIDQFLLKINMENKGIINLWFKNFARATGRIMVTGQETTWVEQTIKSVTDIFTKHRQSLTTMLYSTMVYAMINSVIPLLSTFAIVIVGTAFIIPSHIRQSEVVWWIAAINILLTFKIAGLLSNRLLKELLLRFPYVKWEASIH